MKEKALDWLRYAQADYLVAKMILKPEDLLAGMSAYHSQQAVEKALKAYLIYLDKEIPRSHDLVLLNRLCAAWDIEFLLYEPMAVKLSPFSIRTRYPDDLCNDLTVEEAQILLGCAQECIRLVKSKVM